MHRLFEPVHLDRKSIFWDYRMRSESEFKGYYHWHQICEILFVHEGRGRVVVNRQTWDIRRGMLFFFQPFQLHQVYADVSPDTPYSRTIFYMDPLFMDQLLRPFANRHALFTALWQGSHHGQVYDLKERAEIVEWIYETYDEARQAGTGEEDEELTSLLLQLMNCLHAAVRSAPVPPTDSPERRTPRYSEAMMQWIEEHYHEEINLEKLAEQMHLSKSYVSKVFQQETGSCITDYVTARRIKQACRLLETTNLAVEQIGDAIGYPNASYFIQLFKKEVGTTPHKFRKHPSRTTN